MHVVLVIGLLGLLISGSWAFRSELAVVSFPDSILTERVRQSATDEENDTSDEPESTDTESPAEPESTDTEPPTVSSEVSTQTPIDRAREKLSDSPEKAVRIAYTTTREHFDSPDEATSREFYDNTRDRVSATDELQRLVEIYEQAMFREKIERDEAEKAVEAASKLVSEVT